MSKAKKLASVGLLLTLIVITTLALRNTAKAPTTSTPDGVSTQQTAGNSNNPPAQPPFDKTANSLTNPVSPWVIASKVSALNPITYYPLDLVTPSVPLRQAASSSEMQMRKEAATALEQLFAGAKQAGLSLRLASGFRSYAQQSQVYNSEVKLYGQTVADTESARPGHSEHQTGWAVDVEDYARTCEVTDCFGTLPEGKWVAANAYKYGFIVRYQAGKEAITGYRAEPWHLRYVGSGLASEMHAQNVTTMEEFFNVIPAKQPY